MKKWQKVEHTYNKMVEKQGPAKCVSVSYNKLVRDNIINIIADTGKLAKFHYSKVGNDTTEEYVNLLREKLQEEVNEYVESYENNNNKSGDIQELVDIQEVLNALVALEGYSLKEFQSLRIQKKKERGGFNKGIILEKVQVFRRKEDK